MADRCVDSCIAFIVVAAPLSGPMRDHLADGLSTRWNRDQRPGAAILPELEKGSQSNLLRWQEQVFKHSGPGVVVLRGYGRGEDNIVVNEAYDLVSAEA
jgi:hypothetical protein